MGYLNWLKIFVKRMQFHF